MTHEGNIELPNPSLTDSHKPEDWASTIQGYLEAKRFNDASTYLTRQIRLAGNSISVEVQHTPNLLTAKTYNWIPLKEGEDTRHYFVEAGKEDKASSEATSDQPQTGMSSYRKSPEMVVFMCKTAKQIRFFRPSEA